MISSEFGMKLVLVGAGRLATQFGLALREAGHEVLAVYSRTMESARALSALVGGVPVCQIGLLPESADAFILALKDDAIAQVLPQLLQGRVGQTFFHTAGSVPMSVFADAGAVHYGVVYPMQTFSKERKVDFTRVHIFIEGSDRPTLLLADRLSRSVSPHVSGLSTAERRQLHLAAVFACNFANHCYALADEVLRDCHVSFEAMLPLIEETARKVETMRPADAQTGPAVRYDEQVIRAQSTLLADKPRLRAVYDLMSSSIHESQLNKSVSPAK